MYKTKFLMNNSWDVVHKGRTNIGDYWFDYTVIKEQTNKLGFDLYLVDINGLLTGKKYMAMMMIPNDSPLSRSVLWIDLCLGAQAGCYTCA